jgi:hypothetical protein
MVTAGIIGGSIVLSLIKTAERRPAEALATAWRGWVPFSRSRRARGQGE